MCILLEHANHKELLTSTNNGVKTLEITVTGRRDVVLTLGLLQFHFLPILQIPSTQLGSICKYKYRYQVP